MAKRSLPYVVSRQRTDGSFAHRGYVDVVRNSQRMRLFTATFDTEEAAYAARQRMAGESANTTPAYSLDEAIDELLQELRTKRTKGTVRWYADHTRAICRLIPGEAALHSITRETVEQYVRDRLRVVEGQRKVTAATVNADLRALHRVFAVAIRRGAVRENPVHGVDRPRADTPAMDWFTDQELRNVLQRIQDQRTRDILLLMASTGVRRSELARIEPGHVRLNLGQLIVPGKKRTRAVPLAPDLEAAVRRLLASATTVLVPGGTHAIDDLFRSAKAETGERRLHAHALRHTFCSALVRNGVRPDVVMRLADHRDIKTTMRYVHEVGDEGVDAVKLLRFAPPAESDRSAQG